MKFFGLDLFTKRVRLAAVAALSLFLCLCTRAEQSDYPALHAGPIDIRGVLDAYYSWNTNDPPDGINLYHNFDLHDGLNLNMAEAGLSHKASALGFE